MHLVLASGSPRRRELLERLGLSFTVQPSTVDEAVRAGEAPQDYVQRLAVEKASQLARAGVAVIGADTSVVVDGDILGKPLDDLAAGQHMLQRLSGRAHHVLTGVAVVAGGEVRSTVVRTTVTVASLTPARIQWYLGTGEGRDKAGGYALQGLFGAFVLAVEGSVSSVVGLPLAETVALLEAAGVPLPWSGR